MTGTAWKLGNNVATDEILPFQYMVLTDPAELGKHVLENVRPGFAQQLKPGDVIIAGDNMGYGSSREHAPLALKGAGVGAVIAKSFARIFYRNCINLGIPVIVCPQAADECAEGDVICVDIENGVIEDETTQKRYSFEPFPEFIQKYISKGGLIELLNEQRRKAL